MAEEEQGKSEQASPYKLQQAVQKGAVMKSMELCSYALFVLLWVILAFGTFAFAKGFFAMAQGVVLQSGELAHGTQYTAHIWPLVQQAAHLAFAPLLPWVPVLLALTIAIHFLQSGVVLTTFPLKPDFSKLNPAQGFKRLFQVRMLIEGLKAIVKLLLMAVVLYAILKYAMPKIMGLLQSDVRVLPGQLLHHVLWALGGIIGVLLPVVIFDWAYVRKDYLKRMMMSRREVRDEYKQREGDPRIRAKIRELQAEVRKRSQSLSKIPTAQVLITNPTRLAIAIQYNRDTMAAPAVVAKGAGDLARMMRLLAHRHGIPIVENKPLARALFRKASMDMPVPEQYYQPIAKILAWVLARAAL